MPRLTLEALHGCAARSMARSYPCPGVVVSVVDGMPDQQPVGTITNVPPGQAPGNSIVEDIGGGRYVGYGHFKPGSIRPGCARVRACARGT
jgi:hypothetical protein